MANQVKRVRVASLAQALAAGFVPDGASIRNPKTGSAIALQEFTSFSGMHFNAATTDNDEHPVVLNGKTILAKGLVTQEVKSIEFGAAKLKAYRYEDGSFEISGYILTKEEMKSLLTNDKA